MNGKCIMCGKSLPEGEFHKIYDCYNYVKELNTQLLGFLEKIVENHGFCVFEEDCPDCRTVRKAQLFIEETKDTRLYMSGMKRPLT